MKTNFKIIYASGKVEERQIDLSKKPTVSELVTVLMPIFEVDNEVDNEEAFYETVLVRNKGKTASLFVDGNKRCADLPYNKHVRKWYHGDIYGNVIVFDRQVTF